jgi:hypothetical protein
MLAIKDRSLKLQVTCLELFGTGLFHLKHFKLATTTLSEKEAMRCMAKLLYVEQFTWYFPEKCILGDPYAPRFLAGERVKRRQALESRMEDILSDGGFVRC